MRASEWLRDIFHVYLQSSAVRIAAKRLTWAIPGATEPFKSIRCVRGSHRSFACATDENSHAFCILNTGDSLLRPVTTCSLNNSHPSMRCWLRGSSLPCALALCQANRSVLRNRHNNEGDDAATYCVVLGDDGCNTRCIWLELPRRFKHGHHR